MPEKSKPKKVADVLPENFLLLIALALTLSQPALALTYENVTEVYYEFNWDFVQLQVRSCSQSDCSDVPAFQGPDNTSGSWFTWPNNTADKPGFLTDTNLSNNLYFQYKAFLWTESNKSTPKLYSVSVGYVNETTVSAPAITPSPAYSSAQLNCSATGYRIGGGNLNLTFRWYNGSSFYNETNISSSDDVTKTWHLPAGIQAYGETWNCTVRAYITPTDYSSWKSSTTEVTDETYTGVDDVHYDFLYNYNATNYNNCSIRLQVRSCLQSNCAGVSFIGPDNTSNSWFNNSVYNNLSGTNLPDRRYLQYKIFLNTTDNSTSPRVFNISLGYIQTRNQVTIEAWARGATSGNHSILERTNAYRSYINGSKFAGGFYNGSGWHETQGHTSLSSDEWHHFSLTYSNGSNLKLYLNGIEEASAGEAGRIYLSSNEIYIGASSEANWFNGTIDEVRIYNRSLSAEEVRLSYGSSLRQLNSTHWEFYSNITGEPDGNYSYSGWANDTAGNTGETGTRAVTIDTTPANITIIYPVNNSSLPAGTTWTWINISTNENASCQWDTNSTFIYGIGTNFTATGETHHSYNLTVRNNQTITLYYLCNDSVGNINPTPVMHTFHIKSSWQTFYGHLTGNITLKSSGNQTLTTWLPPDNTGNIYVTDCDSDIHWSKLQALGRNTSGGQSSSDFHEADLALGLTTADDNITKLYTSDGGTTPKNTTNIRAYKTRINNTPITPSTNNTLFWTGILWDTHYDNNQEYDLSENEPLVFITETNENTAGKYGTYDYEIKIPYLLQDLESSTQQISIYIEIK